MNSKLVCLLGLGTSIPILPLCSFDNDPLTVPTLCFPIQHPITTMASRDFLFLSSTCLTSLTHLKLASQGTLIVGTINSQTQWPNMVKVYVSSI